MTFGHYVVFEDESGDHSLTSINAEYPVFVLAFCVFEKERYADRVLPAGTRLLPRRCHRIDHQGLAMMPPVSTRISRSQLKSTPRSEFGCRS